MKPIERVIGLAGRLFEARGADLLRYLRQRVRTDADARDIAQEAYLRFIRLAKPDRVDNPEAYLFRIAGNLLWEHQLRERGLAKQTPLEGTPVEEHTPLELAVTGELASQVRTVLDELPPMPRTVLVLHLRDGMTYAEIGAHVRLSVSMVKRHLGAALAHCRGRLRRPEL